MALQHRQGKDAVLDITVAPQEHLLCKDLRDIAGFVRIVIPAAAVIRQTFQQPFVRTVADRHGGQCDTAVRAAADHIRKIVRLSHTVCQQNDMPDRSLAPGEFPDRLLQCRPDRCAAAVTDLSDPLLDRRLILRHLKLHLPLIPVVEGQNAHIVRIIQIVHGNLCRPDSDVEIADAIISRTARHTAGPVDDHDHRHRRHLVHTPKLHIHRQHSLQHCIPVAAQRKAVLPAAADQTAAVILHISLQTVQKLFRQIADIRIRQYDRLVIQHLIDAVRRIPRRDDTVIAARRTQHCRKARCIDTAP